PGVVVQADEVLRAGEDVHVVEAEPDHPHDGDQPHCGEADHLGRQEQIAETVPPVRAEGASRACGRGLRRGAHAESTGSIAEHTRGRATSRSASGVYTNSSSEESRALATRAPFGATGKMCPLPRIASTTDSSCSAERSPEDCASTSAFSRLDRDGGKSREIFAAFSRPVRWARKASAASCCVPALSATIEDWPTDWMSPAAPPGVGSTSHSKSAPSRSVLAPRKAVVLPAWPPQKSTC